MDSFIKMNTKVIKTKEEFEALVLTSRIVEMVKIDYSMMFITNYESTTDKDCMINWVNELPSNLIEIEIYYE